MSELQKQITQGLAEAYNLLSSADLNLKGGDLVKAAAVLTAFQDIVSALSQGVLVVTEAVDEEVVDETEEG